jgi:lysophospholipase L1-like esterase
MKDFNNIRNISHKGMTIVIFLLMIACKPVEKPFTIYTIGDSTMADKKPEVYPETGWCQVLPELLKEHITLKNHAVNGRSTKSFIYEGRWQAVLDSLGHGDYVFIQFGHNDQKAEDPSRYAVARNGYLRNLEKFVAETRQKGATPVLFTSIVRRKFDETGKLTDTHGEYPEVVREIASAFQVTLIDLEQLTKRLVEDTGVEASKALYLWTEPTERFPNGRQDDTHLSLEGARQLAWMAGVEMKKNGLEFFK